MTPFSVWAPAAQAVELDLGGDRRPMAARPHGWWAVDVEGDLHGARYGFRLDGGELLPDPRSRWQPDGPMAPSAVLDHGRYRWRDRGWASPAWPSAVVYELHVGTFSAAGTFTGAVAHLDHLVDLGVTHVELMPVNVFSGVHGWGYDGVLWSAPHPSYGHPDDLKALVDACHERGLAVLLDVVYNHLGPEGSVVDRFGPYRTEHHQTPWGDAINLDDRGSDAVRRTVVEGACAWLADYHLDGLRLDATHALVDDRATHLLEELAGAVRALEGELRRPLVLVAENDRNDPGLVRPAAVGGFGLDAVWADDLHHTLHTVLTGERQGYYGDFGSLGQVADALMHGFVYRGGYSPARDRGHGGDPAGLPGSAFVVCAQNHDQVGNRARGDRLGALAGTERQMVAAAVVLTSPYVPLLFQGEDWAAGTPFPYFADHQDPALVAAVRRGRLAEFAAFGWDPADVPDPEAEETARSARLRWDERGVEPHRSVLAWYRALLALRRSHPDLGPGDPASVQAAADEAAGVLVVRRGACTVVVNVGDTPACVPVAGPVEVLLGGRGVALRAGTVVVPPVAVAVVGPPSAGG